jgi:hypothetical protein
LSGILDFSFSFLGFAAKVPRRVGNGVELQTRGGIPIVKHAHEAVAIMSNVSAFIKQVSATGRE